jgi:ABC-2 type transport system permease protein
VAAGSEEVLWIRQLGILYHYDAISKGLIDSRDLVYFGSVMGLLLILTKTVMGSRQWQH